MAAGALYRHFPSKGELFVEVFRDAAEKQMAAMRAAAERSADFGGRLEAVIGTYARGAFHNRRLAWALVYEPVDPAVDAERLAGRRRYCDGMAELLRDGIRTGAIPRQNVELAAAAIVGAIAEALVGPLLPSSGTGPSQEEIVAEIVRFCRGAIGLEDRRPVDQTGESITTQNTDVAGCGGLCSAVRRCSGHHTNPQVMAAIRFLRPHRYNAVSTLRGD